MPTNYVNAMTTAGSLSTTVASLLLFLSGFSALVYQVLWTRELGLFFGHTIYAVSAVLTAFMGGLALGSQVGGRLIARVRSPLQAYGWLELGIGAAGALFWLLPPLLDPVYRLLYDSLSTHFYLFNLARFRDGDRHPADSRDVDGRHAAGRQRVAGGARAARARGGPRSTPRIRSAPPPVPGGRVPADRTARRIETQLVAAAVNAAVGVAA